MDDKDNISGENFDDDKSHKPRKWVVAPSAVATTIVVADAAWYSAIAIYTFIAIGGAGTRLSGWKEAYPPSW